MKLYVGNLSYQATEDDLRSAFAAYGNVGEVIVIRDQASGQSKGFGFVEMPSDEEAEKATNALNGQSIAGRPVRVNPARPRGEAPPRREGGRPPRGGGRGGARY